MERKTAEGWEASDPIDNYQVRRKEDWIGKY